MPTASTAFPVNGHAGRELAQKSVDSAGHLLKPYRTFSSVYNTLSRQYRYTWDEAVRQSPQNALAMRRDAFIMALRQERYYPTALLNWHIEPEDDKDADQRVVVGDLTKVVKRTPHLTKLFLSLSEAIWYGRYASQVAWAWGSVNNRPRVVCAKHTPVNGDKLQFTFDDVPCVMVNARWEHPSATILRGDRSPMLALNTPFWRDQFVIHKHECDDADYFDGEMAGAVHGVGLRSRVNWCWWLRDEMLAWAVSFMEKMGTLGLLIFPFAMGNAAQQTAAEQAAKDAGHTNALALPIPEGKTPKDYAPFMIPASDAGIQMVTEIIGGYFERHIERLFVGQSMSSGADKENGLGGTGRANIAADTKYQLLKFDAGNLSETLTTDFVAPLVRFNYPECRWHFRFVFDVPDPSAKDRLDAAKAFVELGGTVVEEEVRKPLGFSEPTEADKILGGQPMGPDAAKPGAPGGMPGAGGQPGQPGGDDPGQPGGQPTPPPPGGAAQHPELSNGKAQQYAAEWNEDDHPRADDGKFGAGSGGPKAGKASEPKTDKPAEPAPGAKDDQPAREWKEQGTKAPAFKAWFGDWEADPANASKVVNAEGEPQETYRIPGSGSMVQGPNGPRPVYHGTASGGFGEFRKDKLSPGSLYGAGFYFTENKEIADSYQNKGRKYEPLRPLGPKDMKAAEKWFKSREIQNDAREDMGMRQSIIEVYREWEKGPEALTAFLASGDTDGNGYAGTLRDKLKFERRDVSNPETKEVYLNIRRPFPLDESMSQVSREDKDDFKAALLRAVDSGDLLPIGDWGPGTDTAKTKADISKVMAEADDSAFTLWDTLSRLTNYVHGTKLSDRDYRNELIRSAGFDGLTHIGGDVMGGGQVHHRVWIAFEPHQIKSASNRGTFDLKDNRIDYLAALDAGPPSGSSGGPAVAYVAWDESAHPRGQPENAGEFGPGGKSAGKAKGNSAASGVKVAKATARAFSGKPVPLKTSLAKHEVGALGERIVIAWLKSRGLKDARPANAERNNFPVDMVQDHALIEVKAGLAGNEPKAQQWRLTIGEPGKAEKAWLATASADEKAAWNARKQQAIRERKQAVLDKASKALGRKVKAKSVTLILNPDTKTADVYEFDGWHDRIGWNSDQAKAAYRGSVKYA